MTFINIKAKTLKSERLILKPLAANDALFILELYNTSGWLKYIGDRNIHSAQAAENYIEKVTINNDACIWTLCLNNNASAPLGIITLIKRDFLQFPDLGYALLPEAEQRGFAIEATMALIDEILKQNTYKKIGAITILENIKSIHLLKKINFKFEREIRDENEILHIYSFDIENI